MARYRHFVRDDGREVWQVEGGPERDYDPADPKDRKRAFGLFAHDHSPDGGMPQDTVTGDGRAEPAARGIFPAA